MGKLTKTFRELVQASDIKRTNNDYCDLVAYFSASSLLAFFRPKVVVPSDGSTPSANFYGLGFMGSGSGKDRLIRMFRSSTEEVEKRLEEYYITTYNTLAASKESDELTTGGSTDKIGQRLGPTFFYSNGTPEGIEKLRSEAATLGIGSTSNVVTELALEIGHLGYLSGLLEMYDFGKSPQKVVQHERREHATDVPMNLLWYSAPENIFNDTKIYEVFKKTLSQGLARRSFCVFLDKDDFTKKETYDKEMYIQKSKELEQIMTSAMKTMPSDTLMTLSDEAARIYDEYHSLSNDRAFENSKTGSYSTELQNRYWKVIKLSAIIALTEGSTVVEDDHINEAIQFADSLDRYQKRTHTVVTEPERILDYLIDSRQPATIHDLQKHNFDINNKNKYEIVDRIEELLLDSDEYILDFTDDRSSKFEVKKLEKTDTENIVFSWSDKEYLQDPNMFPASSSSDKLIENLKNESVNKIGMFLYRGNKRIKDNVVGGGNLLIFDIDEGTPLEYTIDTLSDYLGFVYTSKSHWIDKVREDGTIKSPAQDRYRIVLVSEYALPTDPEEVEDILKNFGKTMGINIDEATTDTARFFFVPKDAEFIELDGERLMDYRWMRSGTKKHRTLASSINKYQKNKDWMFGDLVQMKESAIKWATMGSRNEELFRFTMKLMDTEFSGQSFTIDEIRQHVLEVNECLDHQLSDEEIERTMIKTAKRKMKENK